ncbi:helicase-related protein [Streptomyces adustus]
MYGEHAPAHRRRILDEFASDFLAEPDAEGRDVRAELRVLASVRVLGEGVDTAECDAVLFADARGSMVDIVQMVGRALRTRPGIGKLATLIVPVLLGEDEDANELLTSNAYGTLAKILGALRAHDGHDRSTRRPPRPQRPPAARRGRQPRQGRPRGRRGRHRPSSARWRPGCSGSASEVAEFTVEITDDEDPLDWSPFGPLRYQLKLRRDPHAETSDLLDCVSTIVADSLDEGPCLMVIRLPAPAPTRRTTCPPQWSRPARNSSVNPSRPPPTTTDQGAGR